MLTRKNQPIAAETTDLELHTELCAARYQQIRECLDRIDQRLAQMDSGMDDIRQSIDLNQQRLTDRVFAWGGTIIATLIGCVGWLTVHYILP